jgi:hypothetical protein
MYRTIFVVLKESAAEPAAYNFLGELHTPPTPALPFQHCHPPQKEMWAHLEIPDMDLVSISF